MSNTDSFIDEVTEEVQKDKLFVLLKRWGWIGIVAVLLLVGGAAWNEWRKASERNAAQSFGDAVLAGIEANDVGASLSAVDAATPEQSAILGHLAAADMLSAGETEKAIEALNAIAAQADAPAIYRDLAAFKAALAMSPDLPAEERLAAFDALTGPGAPFSILAGEQRALILIEMGQKDEAVAALTGLVEQSSATPGLQRRVAELIVALGGPVETGSEEN